MFTMYVPAGCLRVRVYAEVREAPDAVEGMDGVEQTGLGRSKKMTIILKIYFTPNEF
jgi:hypothetical protein